MPLTRDLRETLKNRVERDPEFRNGLLAEALEDVVRGELSVAKILLRDYINATEGFEAVGIAIDKSPKALMRMFSPVGIPTVKNLISVTSFLQKKAGETFCVVSVEPRKSSKKSKNPLTGFQRKSKRNVVAQRQPDR